MYRHVTFARAEAPLYKLPHESSRLVSYWVRGHVDSSGMSTCWAGDSVHLWWHWILFFFWALIHAMRGNDILLFYLFTFPQCRLGLLPQSNSRIGICICSLDCLVIFLSMFLITFYSTYIYSMISIPILPHDCRHLSKMFSFSVVSPFMPLCKDVCRIKNCVSLCWSTHTHYMRHKFVCFFS